jgi:hypothetical protein
MKVTRVYDITWETDGEEIDLPTEVELPRDFGDDDDAIADFLSDEYGWLVISYERESVEPYWAKL